ncbi:Uncharacterised protein [Burkholderia pseudomallei]|nr:Uncharacterised protein [Burkholderia pseudomallei]
MPVPRRDAAEQRRAARGGVGAVDRVQLDVERIGQQLPPARLDRAAAREPQRAHGRAVRANRVEPRTQRERDAFERRAHQRAARIAERQTEPAAARGGIHPRRALARQVRQKADLRRRARAERIVVRRAPIRIDEPAARRFERDPDVLHRGHRVIARAARRTIPVQARARRRALRGQHDDLPARARREQRVAVAREAAAKRRARRVARARRECDPGGQAERARRIGR